MHSLQFFTNHPMASKLAYGILSGIAGAAAVDLHAFETWKTWQEGIKYDWSTATLRWFQGAVVGGATGLGLGAFFS